MNQSQGILQRTTGTRARTEPQQSELAREQEADALVERLSRQRFEEYLTKTREKLIKDKLITFYDKNYVQKYKEEYGFEEEWEDRTQTVSSEFDLTSNSSRINEVLSIVLCVIFLGSVLFSTVDYFFKRSGPRTAYSVVYGVSMGALTYDAAMLVYFYVASHKERNCDVWEGLQSIYPQIVVVTYFGLKLWDIPERRNYLWTGLQVLIIVLLIHIIRKIESSFRFLRFLFNVQNEAKIVDMFLTLIVILHIMATIFMCTTYPHPHHNWLTSLDIPLDNEFVVYLRAFYFATTTVLTVGYGDISPRNDLEVGVVTMVELSGIIIFAYLINEIGYCMSQLRKETEIVDKDLSTVEKIRQHYRMTSDTTTRLRAFVMNQKSTACLVEPEAERDLMSKLNEDLREDVQKENYFSIVKTSLFFLLRWTKSFQKVIANNLTHVLFSSNELLYQPQGKERIYIIRVGRVNVYAKRSKGRRGTNNILKTIVADLSKEVFDNTYGWTAVMSQRPARLYAYTKDYTSAYYIEKPQFEQAALGQRSDFQYYHEVQDRIGQAACWQAFELPVLQSPKHHFTPTRYVVLHKEKEDCSKIQRASCSRRKKTRKLKERLRQGEEKERLRKRFTIIQSDVQVERTMVDRERTCTHVTFDLDRDTVVMEKLDNRSQGISRETVTKVLTNFEMGKDYDNYFPKQNQTNLLKAYQSTNFQSSKSVTDDLRKSFHNSRKGTLVQ